MTASKDKSIVFGVPMDAKKEKQFKLRGKPYILRADGRIEWICSHGIGHTIAVSNETLKSFPNRKLAFVHGCDGCCIEKIKNKQI